MKWSFNRKRDSSKIKTQVINWEGPYALPKFEKLNGLPTLPECCGVYLFTCDYLDSLVLYGIGITMRPFKERIVEHRTNYFKGEYNVLDIDALKRGLRKEIWHGWQYASDHQEEYIDRKEEISVATQILLQHIKIFIAKTDNKRMQERIEGAIAHQLYVSKEPYSDIIDGGMHLKGRYNAEMPILINNVCGHKIYGLPEKIEI